jgi:uncharacterized protein YlxW (UPF0749 family)
VTTARRGVLEEFMGSVLVDDYADVREDQPAQGSPVRRSGALAVAAVIGLIVVSALFTTLSSSDQRIDGRQALLARIDTATAAVDEKEAAVTIQRSGVERMQQDMLVATDEAPAIAAQASALAGPTGTAALAGPGVSVTLDDAPDADAGSLNRVLDRDVQDVVNALWQAGATGIAINGQRLTGTTAIRSAGEAILVNYRPLTRPYRVDAVGAIEAPASGSALSSLLGGLSRDYGLVTTATGADVALPAGDVRVLRFAEPGSTPSTSNGGVE